MIGFYDYTVIATYLATVSGVTGLFQAMEGNLGASLVCLLLCGALDTVDGRIARTKKNRTENEKRFGIQLDSLNDIVCFGALPAAIAYASAPFDGKTPVWFTASLVFYVLCGLIRLAYFNVTEEERQQQGSHPRTQYLGLPITCGTLVTPLLFILWRALFPAHAAAVFAAGLALTGLLFILPVYINKPRLPGLILLGLAAAAEMAGLVLVLR